MDAIRVSQFQIESKSAIVENSQYVAIASEYLPAQIQVKQVRVEYKKAAKLGKDCLVPTIARQEDIYYITLCDPELNPYAIVAFRLNKVHSFYH